MRVIIEGPDGVGKSTLVKYIQDKYNLNMLHSSSSTKNDFEYHMDLIKDDNVVCDRCNLGEIVYPTIYGRKAKMNWSEQLDYMNYCNDNGVIYIIFYASNFEDLKERLFSRGDTEQVLKNAEKINLLFMLLARMFAQLYSNVYELDISKYKDQVEFFKDIEKERNNNGK